MVSETGKFYVQGGFALMTNFSDPSIYNDMLKLSQTMIEMKNAENKPYAMYRLACDMVILSIGREAFDKINKTEMIFEKYNEIFKELKEFNSMVMPEPPNAD
jgi:hypothetical protein